MKREYFKDDDAAQKRLLEVRREMEALGPVILGTLTRRTQKYTVKGGETRVCRAPSSLKLAGTGNLVTMRIPRKCEGMVAKMVEDGRKWRELEREYAVLSSFLAARGVLKKTPHPARAEVRGPDGDTRVRG